MGYMKTVIEKIKEENIQVKVMIGVVPLFKSFTNQIVVDGYAKNASDAVKPAKTLMVIVPKEETVE